MTASYLAGGRIHEYCQRGEISVEEQEGNMSSMGIEDIMDKITELMLCTRSVNGYWTLMERIVPSLKLRCLLLEDHDAIIRQYIESDRYSPVEKISFVVNYPKLMKECKNCAAITNVAENSIEEDADPESVSGDWYDFFFDKVRVVSDEKMQFIWSKVLSGEINSPGRYSKSLIHALSIMESDQAAAFCNVVKFCVFDDLDSDTIHPLIFIRNNRAYYEQYGVTYSNLKSLERLGFIQCNFEEEYVFPGRKYFLYGDNRIRVDGNPANDRKVLAGNVMLTYDGRKMFDLVSSEYKIYRGEIMEYIIRKFQNRKCTVFIDDVEL